MKTDHVRKLRRCLRCDRMFDSSWAGERICPACRCTNHTRCDGAGHESGEVARYDQRIEGALLPRDEEGLT